jgi:hypothetical protein
VSTAALCVAIALACRNERMAAMQQGRLLAEDGSERLFLVMFDVASADQRGGICSHGRLACIGGGDHGALQLAVISRRFVASLDSDVQGVEGVFGGFLGGLGLTDLSKGHGWYAVELFGSGPLTVTRGGHNGAPRLGQFAIRNAHPIAQRLAVDCEQPIRVAITRQVWP